MVLYNMASLNDYDGNEENSNLPGVGGWGVGMGVGVGDLYWININVSHKIICCHFVPQHSSCSGIPFTLFCKTYVQDLISAPSIFVTPAAHLYTEDSAHSLDQQNTWLPAGGKWMMFQDIDQHCKAILGRGQPGIMRWISVTYNHILSLSIYLSISISLFLNHSR